MFGANKRVRPVVWCDNTGNGYAIAPFQIVCLASAAEISTGAVPGVVGDVVVVPPITNGFNTLKIAGVTLEAAKHGESVPICFGGICEVMANAAITWDEQATWLFCGAASTRTTAQTPFTNLKDRLIKDDPSNTRTYQLAMAARTATVIATNGANTPYFPLGYPLDIATAQYDVIRVELDLGLRYA